jgi:hypothetical protein
MIEKPFNPSEGSIAGSSGHLHLVHVMDIYKNWSEGNSSAHFCRAALFLRFSLPLTVPFSKRES